LHKHADSGEEAENYVPRSKILDCTTSCVDVASVGDLLQQKQNLLSLLSHALSPSFPWTGDMNYDLIVDVE